MVGADRSRPQLLRLFQEASGKEVVVRAALQGDVVSNDLPQSLSGEKIAIGRPVTHLVTGNLHRVTRARARSTPCFEKWGSRHGGDATGRNRAPAAANRVRATCLARLNRAAPPHRAGEAIPPARRAPSPEPGRTSARWPSPG